MTDLPQALSQRSFPEQVPLTRELGHVLCLDGVRAVSILLVLIAHTAPIGPKAWLFNAMAGRMGMALFFCLSGYLIVSMLYRKPDVAAFIAKRVIRILPALFVYLTVLLLFFDLPIRSYLLNLAFVSNYVVSGLDGGPVGHLWSLCIEMHFYVAIAIAVLLGGRHAVWMVIPAALVITSLRIEAGVISNISRLLKNPFPISRRRDSVCDQAGRGTGCVDRIVGAGRSSPL